MRILERVSQVWVYGTKKMLEFYSREEVIEELVHTLPDGRWVENYVMSVEEAEETLRTGEFPDRLIRMRYE